MGMREMPSNHLPVVDCFNAQEHFAHGIERHILTEGIVRLSFWTSEPTERIVRVKVIMSIRDIMRERQQTGAFLAMGPLPNMMAVG